MRSVFPILVLACRPVEEPPDCVPDEHLTWSTFGRGFLDGHCQGCHASGAPDRHDAPEDVVFDTVADIRAHRDDMLAVATGSSPTMPPRGGPSDDDRARLARWLQCDDDLADDDSGLPEPIPPELAEVEDAITSYVVAAREPDPASLFAAYAAMLAHGDDACPPWDPDAPELYGVEFWTGDCTSTDGTRFQGALSHFDYGPGEWVADGYTYEAHAYLEGFADLSTADGEVLSIAGQLFYDDFTANAGGARTGSAYWNGQFSWDDEEVSANLGLSGTDYGDSVRLVLEGPILAEVPGFDAVQFALLTYGTGEPGPKGDLQLRRTGGEWVAVSFAQQPCGDVFWRGSDLGPVCPSLAPWVAFSGRPW